MAELTARAIGAQDVAVHGMEFSPDSRLLAVSRGDKTLQLWDTASWQTAREYSAMHGYTRALAFSPDGAMLAVADGDSIDIISAGSGQRVNRLRLPDLPDAIGLLQFSDDGKGLVGAIWDEGEGRSYAFEWEMGAVEPATLVRLDGLVTRVWCARPGDAVVATYEQKLARRFYTLRNISRARLKAELDLGSFQAGGAPVSSSGATMLALGNRCFGSGVQLLSMANAEVLFESGSAEHSTPRVAFSPDDTFLAVAHTPLFGSGSTLAVISAKGGRQIWEVKVATTIDHIAVAPTGDIIATVSQKELCARFWNRSDGSLAATSCIHVGPCRFSPDHKWFATGRGAVRVTDLSPLLATA